MKLQIVLLLLMSPVLYAQPLPALIPYKTKQGWGYSDSNKVIHIKPSFQSAGLFYDGRAIVTIGEKEREIHCLIDEKGNYIIPLSYHWNGKTGARNTYIALNVFDSNGRWGLTDRNGKLIIPFLYDHDKQSWGLQSLAPVFHKANGFDSWFLIAAKDGRQGVIDTLNRVLIPFVYKEIRESVAGDTLRGWVVRTDSLYGVLQKDGKVLYAERYQQIYPVYEKGWASVRQHGKMGVVDTNSRILVPLIYDSVAYSGGTLSSGYATLLKGKWGWRNIYNGKSVRPAYSNAPYGMGKYVVAGVDTGGIWKEVLLDEEGKVLVPPLYDRFILWGDSILVNNTMDLHNGEGWGTYHSLLDKKTKKPLRWEKGCTGCGVVEAAPPVVQSGEQEVYTIDSNGKSIRSFVKEGLQWDVCAYVKDRSANNLTNSGNLFYGVVSVNIAKDTFYAVVNKQCDFIIRPQQEYKITGGDFHLNWLIVKTRNGRYAVTDTALQLLAGPVQRKVYTYFKWNNKVYFIGEWQAGQRKYGYQEGYNCFRCNCLTVLDSKGNILKGFAPFCDPRFFSIYNLPAEKLQNDRIMVRDSLGRMGIVNLEGKVQYPKVSFKSASLAFLGEDLVSVSDVNRSELLVDTDNKRCFPDLRIKGTSTVSTHPFYDFSQSEMIHGLYRLNYINKANEQTEFVFIDRWGTVYADF